MGKSLTSFNQPGNMAVSQSASSGFNITQNSNTLSQLNGTRATDEKLKTAKSFFSKDNHRHPLVKEN